MASKKKPIHVFQFWHAGSEPVEPYADCIERTRATPWIDSYELVRFHPQPGRFLSGTVDLLKLQMARDNPFGFFIDADIYLTKRPPFDHDDLPYFDVCPITPIQRNRPRNTAKVRNAPRIERRDSIGFGGEPHIAAFYVNGCVDWFRQLPLPKRPAPKIGWTQPLLARRPFHILPTTCFVHLIAKKGRVGWSVKQAKDLLRATEDAAS